MSKDGMPSVRELRARLAERLSPSATRTREDWAAIAKLSAQVGQLERKHRREGWSLRHSAELTALLAEYDGLRQESLYTINNRARLMILGLAAIGALLGGSLSVPDPTQRAGLIWVVFSLAVPVVSSVVIVITAGEAMRMKRAADYLASDLEAKINHLFGRVVLSWETCLRTGALPRDEIVGPSMYVVIVFGLFAFLVPLFGLEVTKTPYRLIGPGRALWQLWVPWSLLALTALFLVLNRNRLLNDPKLSPAMSALDLT